MFIPNNIWARVCFARTAWRGDRMKDNDQSPISYFLTFFSVLALGVISFNFSSYPLLIKCIFGSFHCRHAQLCAFSPVILLLHSSKFAYDLYHFNLKVPPIYHYMKLQHQQHFKRHLFIRGIEADHAGRPSSPRRDH
jgi:hypothetical protein